MKGATFLLVLLVACFTALIVGTLVENKGAFIHEVPFTCQAPNSAKDRMQWKISEFAFGCEEACGAMIFSWIGGEKTLSIGVAEKRILALCRYQERELGFFQDTGVEDTARVLRGFWGFDCVVSDYPTADNLKEFLNSGNVVMVPINGTLNGLRSERKEGADYKINYNLHKMDRHMVLLVGYDDAEEGTFIVHDPATIRGAFYHFNQEAFVASICDYPSRGDWEEEKIKVAVPRVIVISRKGDLVPINGIDGSEIGVESHDVTALSVIICFDESTGDILWEEDDILWEDEIIEKEKGGRILSITHIGKASLPVPENGQGVIGLGLSAGGTEVLTSFQFDSDSNKLVGHGVSGAPTGKVSPETTKRFTGEILKRVGDYLLAQWK